MFVSSTRILLTKRALIFHFADHFIRPNNHTLGHEDINMTANIYTAVQGSLTTSEMLKLMGESVELPEDSVQHFYNKLGRFYNKTA